MNFNNSIHHDLIAAQKIAYDQIGLRYDKFALEKESQEYGACSFEMNNKIINFRVAKTTPTKIGQFVTYWKRIGSGPIMPYDINDNFDFLIISVRNAQHFGQFVFPKDILFKHGLISKNLISGKRAMRVYPPWDITDNSQAKKTQQWQIAYFFQIQPNTDIIKLKKLFA